MSEYIMKERIVAYAEYTLTDGDMVSLPADIREEIVRCRDCKFFDTRKCKSEWPFYLDAYCWWGERKVDA